MMTRFGGIDMKEGNVDRGRTIFEGLVAKFPKRGDVWSVYLDMEKAVMKRGKVDGQPIPRWAKPRGTLGWGAVQI